MPNESDEIAEAISSSLMGPMSQLLGPQNVLNVAQAADAFLSAAQRCRQLRVAIYGAYSTAGATVADADTETLTRLQKLEDACINRAERLFVVRPMRDVVAEKTKAEPLPLINEAATKAEVKKE